MAQLWCCVCNAHNANALPVRRARYVIYTRAAHTPRIRMHARNMYSCNGGGTVVGGVYCACRVRARLPNAAPHTRAARPPRRANAAGNKQYKAATISRQ